MENEKTKAWQFFLVNRGKNIARIAEWERKMKDGLLALDRFVEILESMACCGAVGHDLRVNERKFEQWEDQVYAKL